VANERPVTRRARCDRTARLLDARLRSLRGLEGRERALRLELAAVATENALRLRLLEPGQAEAIWATAVEPGR
jgi:hypothetical protein